MQQLSCRRTSCSTTAALRLDSGATAATADTWTVAEVVSTWTGADFGSAVALRFLPGE